MAALQRLREEKERFTVETLSLSYQSSGIRGREDDADWADDVEPRGNRRVPRAAAAASSAVAASLSHLLTSQFQDGDLEQLLRSAVPLAGVAGSAGLQEAKDYLRQVLQQLQGEPEQAVECSKPKSSRQRSVSKRQDYDSDSSSDVKSGREGDDTQMPRDVSDAAALQTAEEADAASHSGRPAASDGGAETGVQTADSAGELPLHSSTALVLIEASRLPPAAQPPPPHTAPTAPALQPDTGSGLVAALPPQLHLPQLMQGHLLPDQFMAIISAAAAAATTAASAAFQNAWQPDARLNQQAGQATGASASHGQQQEPRRSPSPEPKPHQLHARLTPPQAGHPSSRVWQGAPLHGGSAGADPGFRVVSLANPRVSARPPLASPSPLTGDAGAYAFQDISHMPVSVVHSASVRRAGQALPVLLSVVEQEEGEGFEGEQQAGEGQAGDAARAQAARPLPAVASQTAAKVQAAVAAVTAVASQARAAKEGSPPHVLRVQAQAGVHGPGLEPEEPRATDSLQQSPRRLVGGSAAVAAGGAGATPTRSRAVSSVNPAAGRQGGAAGPAGGAKGPGLRRGRARPATGSPARAVGGGGAPGGVAGGLSRHSPPRVHGPSVFAAHNIVAPRVRVQGQAAHQEQQQQQQDGEGPATPEPPLLLPPPPPPPPPRQPAPLPAELQASVQQVLGALREPQPAGHAQASRAQVYSVAPASAEHEQALRSALAALGGEFNYHSALAELDILKRSSLLMAGPSGSAASPGREAGLAGASALRAALAAAAGGGEVANGADGTALPPVQHPWDDEVAWHNMDAFAKVVQQEVAYRAVTGARAKQVAPLAVEQLLGPAAGRTALGGTQQAARGREGGAAAALAAGRRGRTDAGGAAGEGAEPTSAGAARRVGRRVAVQGEQATAGPSPVPGPMLDASAVAAEHWPLVSAVMRRASPPKERVKPVVAFGRRIDATVGPSKPQARPTRSRSPSHTAVPTRTGGSSSPPRMRTAARAAGRQTSGAGAAHVAGGEGWVSDNLPPATPSSDAGSATDRILSALASIVFREGDGSLQSTPADPRRLRGEGGGIGRQPLAAGGGVTRRGGDDQEGEAEEDYREEEVAEARRRQWSLLSQPPAQLLELLRGIRDTQGTWIGADTGTWSSGGGGSDNALLAPATATVGDGRTRGARDAGVEAGHRWTAPAGGLQPTLRPSSQQAPARGLPRFMRVMDIQESLGTATDGTSLMAGAAAEAGAAAGATGQGQGSTGPGVVAAAGAPLSTAALSGPLGLDGGEGEVLSGNVAPYGDGGLLSRLGTRMPPAQATTIHASLGFTSGLGLSGLSIQQPVPAEGQAGAAGAGGGGGAAGGAEGLGLGGLGAADWERQQDAVMDALVEQVMGQVLARDALLRPAAAVPASGGGVGSVPLLLDPSLTQRLVKDVLLEQLQGLLPHTLSPAGVGQGGAAEVPGLGAATGAAVGAAGAAAIGAVAGGGAALFTPAGLAGAGLPLPRYVPGKASATSAAVAPQRTGSSAEARAPGDLDALNHGTGTGEAVTAAAQPQGGAGQEGGVGAAQAQVAPASIALTQGAPEPVSISDAALRSSELSRQTSAVAGSVSGSNVRPSAAPDVQRVGSGGGMMQEAAGFGGDKQQQEGATITFATAGLSREASQARSVHSACGSQGADGIAVGAAADAGVTLGCSGAGSRAVSRLGSTISEAASKAGSAAAVLLSEGQSSVAVAGGASPLQAQASPGPQAMASPGAAAEAALRAEGLLPASRQPSSALGGMSGEGEAAAVEEVSQVVASVAAGGMHGSPQGVRSVSVREAAVQASGERGVSDVLAARPQQQSMQTQTSLPKERSVDRPSTPPGSRPGSDSQAALPPRPTSPSRSSFMPATIHVPYPVPVPLFGGYPGVSPAVDPAGLTWPSAVPPGPAVPSPALLARALAAAAPTPTSQALTSAAAAARAEAQAAAALASVRGMAGLRDTDLPMGRFRLPGLEKILADSSAEFDPAASTSSTDSVMMLPTLREALTGIGATGRAISAEHAERREAREAAERRVLDESLREVSLQTMMAPLPRSMPATAAQRLREQQQQQQQQQVLSRQQADGPGALSRLAPTPITAGTPFSFAPSGDLDSSTADVAVTATHSHDSSVIAAAAAPASSGAVSRQPSSALPSEQQGVGRTASAAVSISSQALVGLGAPPSAGLGVAGGAAVPHGGHGGGAGQGRVRSPEGGSAEDGSRQGSALGMDEVADVDSSLEGMEVLQAASSASSSQRTSQGSGHGGGQWGASAGGGSGKGAGDAGVGGRDDAGRGVGSGAGEGTGASRGVRSSASSSSSGGPLNLQAPSAARMSAEVVATPARSPALASPPQPGSFSFVQAPQLPPSAGSQPSTSTGMMRGGGGVASEGGPGAAVLRQSLMHEHQRSPLGPGPSAAGTATAMASASDVGAAAAAAGDSRGGAALPLSAVVAALAHADAVLRASQPQAQTHSPGRVQLLSGRPVPGSPAGNPLTASQSWRELMPKPVFAAPLSSSLLAAPVAADQATGAQAALLSSQFTGLSSHLARESVPGPWATSSPGVLVGRDEAGRSFVGRPLLPSNFAPGAGAGAGQPPSLSDYQGPIRKLWRPTILPEPGASASPGDAERWSALRAPGYWADSSLEASTVTPDLSMEGDTGAERRGGFLVGDSVDSGSSSATEGGGAGAEGRASSRGATQAHFRFRSTVTRRKQQLLQQIGIRDPLLSSHSSSTTTNSSASLHGATQSTTLVSTL